MCVCVCIFELNVLPKIDYRRVMLHTHTNTQTHPHNGVTSGQCPILKICCLSFRRRSKKLFSFAGRQPHIHICHAHTHTPTLTHLHTHTHLHTNTHTHTHTPLHTPTHTVPSQYTPNTHQQRRHMSGEMGTRYFLICSIKK